MIGANVLCRIIRLDGLYAPANNRFVTTRESYVAENGAIGWTFEPEIMVQQFPNGAKLIVAGVPEKNLQPISNPDPPISTLNFEPRERKRHGIQTSAQTDTEKTGAGSIAATSTTTAQGARRRVLTRFKPRA